MDPYSIGSIVLLVVVFVITKAVFHFLNRDTEAKQLVRIGKLEHENDMLLPCSNPVCITCFSSVKVKKISEPSVAQIIREARRVTDEVLVKQAEIRAKLDESERRIRTINNETALSAGYLSPAERRATELGVTISIQRDERIKQNKYTLIRGNTYVAFSVLDEEIQNNRYIAEDRLQENLAKLLKEICLNMAYPDRGYSTAMLENLDIDIVTADQYAVPIRAKAPAIPTRMARI